MDKNKKIGVIAAIVIIIVLIIGLVVYQNKQTQKMIQEATDKIINQSQTQPTSTVTILPKATPEPTTNIAKDPQNATYTIEGKKVSLINGKAENANGNVQMFGEPATGDLNGDSVNDAGVILVVSGSGSGTFYYSAAALNNTSNNTYQGTNSILLGDRIAPQTKNIQNEIYTVNFAERAEGEPMSSQPSVGVSKHFKVTNNTLVETNQ